MGDNTNLDRQAEFRASSYFPQLDGLRAVSVLMVLCAHSTGWLFRPVSGYLGVTLFFVISGFLITTLLLREEQRDGRVSLRGFYLRRTFRIFPLYYLALLAYTALVLVGLGGDRGEFLHRSVFFWTYLNELASPGTFGHSWSLGVEEKYYLVWPLLAFVVPLTRRHRVPLALALLTACVVAGVIGPHAYLGQYGPILMGVVVALALHDPASFRRALILTRPGLLTGLLLLLGIGFWLDSGDNDHVTLAFGAAVALSFPTLLVGPRWLRRWLETRPLQFVGRRSYAIYLFHPIVASVIDKSLEVRDDSPAPLQVCHYMLLLVGSLLVADGLYRWFEQPLIRLGRRVAAGSRGRPKPAGVQPVSVTET